VFTGLEVMELGKQIYLLKKDGSLEPLRKISRFCWNNIPIYSLGIKLMKIILDAGCSSHERWAYQARMTRLLDGR